MFSIDALLKYLPVSLRTVFGAALIGGALLVGKSWLVSHDAATLLKATLAAQTKTLQDATTSQQQRDASLASALAAITAAKAAVKTPLQAAAQIPQVLPPLPDLEPIRVELPPAPAPESASTTSTMSPDGQTAIPAASNPNPAPAIITVPQDDLKPLYDGLQDCRACQAQLSATKSDLDDERRKTAALTQERDAAIHAAHGTFWSRLAHTAKWALIGGAVGASIALAARK